MTMLDTVVQTQHGAPPRTDRERRHGFQGRAVRGATIRRAAAGAPSRRSDGTASGDALAFGPTAPHPGYCRRR